MANLAADVVEIDVDPGRAERGEPPRQRALAVVERGDAERLEPGHLRRAARRADDGAAQQHADLAGHRPAPAAPETKTVSPRCSLPMCFDGR